LLKLLVSFKSQVILSALPSSDHDKSAMNR
jgi:hypothetical protein